MLSFEEQLVKLEALVARMEGGELSLEDSVKLFEEGLALSNSCKLELEAAEGRIQMLVEQSNGRLKAQPVTGESLRGR